jgi:hypothetical protein
MCVFLSTQNKIEIILYDDVGGKFLFFLFLDYIHMQIFGGGLSCITPENFPVVNWI